MSAWLSRLPHTFVGSIRRLGTVAIAVVLTTAGFAGLLELATAAPAAAATAATVTVTATPGVSTIGTVVTVTATVAPGSGSGPTPTGSVQFFISGSQVGTTNCSVGSSEASCLTNGTATTQLINLSAGTYTIYASYSGDTNYGHVSYQASMPTTITVNNPAIDNTTTTLTISPANVVAGDVSTLTAQVVDQNGLPVTSGTVTFFNVTNNDTIATESLNSEGEASFTSGNWQSGTWQIEASYLGPSTADYSASSQTEFFGVLAAPFSTSTTITSSPSQVFTGQPFSITASVSSNNDLTLPTGTVTFYANGTSIGTASLGANGTATLDYTGTLSPGATNITASYGGDLLDQASLPSAPAPLNVMSIDSSSTTASASSASVQLGTPVTLSAVVSPGTSSSGTPTGSVIFTLGTANGPVLCSGTLSAGSASCSSSGLPVGSDTVVATYGGDSGHTGSFSTTQVTVTPANSSTTVSASPASSSPGTSVALSANVVSPAGLSPAPTGSVTFTLGTASGPVLCSATLTGSTASCSTSTLPAGTDTVVASYSGDANYLGSSATTSATVTSSVTVTVSGSQGYGSSKPTFTYQASGLPAGLTLSGTATCRTVGTSTAIGPGLAAGSYTILGSSCSGLTTSSPSVVVDYVGATNGYVVTSFCSASGNFTIPSGAAGGITGSKSGNVTVLPGQTLYIEGGTLSGNVTVDSGGTFLMSSGTLAGNLTVAPAATVTVVGGTIKGNLSSALASISLARLTIDGNVTVVGGTLLADGVTVNGNIQTVGASWVALCGGTISGNVQVQLTLGVPPSTVSSATPAENYLCGLTINGNLQLQANAASVPFEVGQGPDCASGLTVHGGVESPPCCNPPGHTGCGSVSNTISNSSDDTNSLRILGGTSGD